MLHGFTGSTKTWEQVAKHVATSTGVIAIDLIGHGQTEAQRIIHYIQWNNQVS